MSAQLTSLPLLAYVTIFEYLTIKELAKLQEVCRALYDAVELARKVRNCKKIYLKEPFIVIGVEGDKQYSAPKCHGWQHLKWWRPRELCTYPTKLLLNIPNEFFVNVKKYVSHEALRRDQYITVCKTVSKMPNLEVFEFYSEAFSRGECDAIIKSISLVNVKHFELKFPLVYPMHDHIMENFLKVTHNCETRSIRLMNNWYTTYADKVVPFLGFENFFKREGPLSGTMAFDLDYRNEGAEILKVLEKCFPENTKKETDYKVRGSSTQLNITVSGEHYGTRILSIGRS